MVRIDIAPRGRLGGQLALGLAYWLLFVLVLEPGNIIRALDAGFPAGLDR